MNAEYRAMKARQILEDEVMIEALAAIESKAIRAALNVPPWHGRLGDRKRRRLLEKVNMVKELRSELQAVITAGKQAARPQSGVA